MSEKNINSRIQHKHDIEANWLKATNFIPKAGEIIVYDVDENYSYPRIKIGDGQLNINSLKFINGNIDWNAAEGEVGHVLNRTHWTETGEVEVLPEITVRFDDEGVSTLLAPVLELEIGKEYTVTWNGTEYKTVGIDVTAQQFPGVALGNVGHAADGLPFVIGAIMPQAVDSVGYAIVITSYKGIAPATVSISCEGEIVHKLDGKFLPDGLPYSEFAEGVILPETIVEIILDETNPEERTGILLEPVLNIIGGNEYTVTWNDTEYKCVAHDASVLTGGEIAGGVLGNVGMMDGSGDSGEPFIIVALDSTAAAKAGYACGFVPLDGSESVTVSISGVIETVHKLDGKFLPEGLPYTEFTEGIVLPETLVEFDDDGMAPLDKTGTLCIGEKYIVTWNGTGYETLCLDGTQFGEAGFVLGNVGAMLGGADTGEPFIIMCLPALLDNVGMMIMALDDSISASVSIKGKIGTIHKMDKLYLPDDINDLQNQISNCPTYDYVNNELKYVSYDKDQGLSEEEQARACNNIGAANLANINQIGTSITNAVSQSIISSLTWDGNIGNRAYLTMDESDGVRAVFVHVSDEVPSFLAFPASISVTRIEESDNGALILNSEIALLEPQEIEGLIAYIYGENIDSSLVLIIPDDQYAEMLQLPCGVYFGAQQMNISEDQWLSMAWTSSLHLFGYGFSTSSGGGNAINLPIAEEGEF